MSDKVEKFDEKKPETVGDRPWVAPRVDIYENDNEILLIADVPSVNKEQLQINLDKEELTIAGTVGDEFPGTLLSREFRGVDYRRKFIVPASIDPSKITADLKNGVLCLHLPKAEELKPRQITVKAG